ncbi:MAG: AAA family ATPase [Gemmatimonadota bacterium]|nr:AAA family ATPase [Gemmatimonadota bacterium]
MKDSPLPDSTLLGAGRMGHHAGQVGGDSIPGPLPLVGRDADLHALWGLLDGNGRGASVAVISGEGGVGKSRLAAELARRAEGEGWSVVQGRAYPVETGVPYALFADAFLPIMREMDPARLAILSRGGEAELRRLFPALGGGERFVDDSGDPTEFRTRLLWNFTEFTKSYGKRSPLLLVLEDLQWADGSSLELLHFLARQVTEDPVFIVCTYNDAEREPNAQLVRTERSLMSLGVAALHRLDPLGLEDVVHLVSATFDTEATVVRDLAALLFEWTRGNAFFIEEILKSMVASGRLCREDGVWVGWDAADFSLPGSIRDAVLDRIRALSPDARTVIELAAVVGARARYPVIAALSRLEEADLLAALDELRVHGVLEEREEGDVVVYVFAHPLVRQTLYRELGLQRARVLHGRVAEALEVVHGDRALEHADELAYHFSRTDSATLRSKAAAYLTAAGRRALDRRADQEAVRYLEEARELTHTESPTDEGPDRVELASLLARAKQHLGEFDEAVALWTEALEGVPAGDRKRLDLMRALGMAHFWCGRHEEAHRVLDAGFDAARVAGDAEAMVRLRVAKGHCLHEVGRGDEALETVRLALPLAEELSDAALLARVHRALELLHVWIGPPGLAHEHGHRAIELALKVGDVSVEFWARWGWAVLGGMRGDPERTHEAIAELTELADRARSPVLRLWTDELEIEFAYGRGEWDAGMALGERAITLATDLRQRTILPRLLVWTAQFHLGRGHQERARELIDRAVEMARPDQIDRPVDVHQVVPTCIGLAHYRIGVGDYAGAIEAGERGFEIAEGTGYTLWAVHRLLPVLAEACLWAGEIDRAGQIGTRLRTNAERLDHKLGLAWADACDALVRWKQGDPKGAIALMRRSSASLEEIPMIPYAARVRRQLAGRLLEIGDREGALAELKHVHETCVRLGATPELEKTRLMFREAGHPAPPKGSGEGLAGLTDREMEVARLTVQRLTNAEIGRRLGIAARTVSTHLSKIYGKLDIGSRGELADLVRERVEDAP